MPQMSGFSSTLSTSFSTSARSGASPSSGLIVSRTTLTPPTTTIAATTTPAMPSTGKVVSVLVYREISTTSVVRMSLRLSKAVARSTAESIRFAMFR